jgi:glycosyltransferase involved in cell wall biosynthesis
MQNRYARWKGVAIAKYDCYCGRQLGQKFKFTGDVDRKQRIVTKEVRLAVLVPCFNEARTVARVVADFRAALPDSTVFVYDNGSTDGTDNVARAAGAVVRREPRPGKGVVVRRMFAEVDAEIYVLADGDATYDATCAPAMVAALVKDDLDLVTGVRDHEGRDAAYRRGHRFGNRSFNALLGFLFGERPTDMFSGYRVLSRRFVKSFPVEARGFEFETELTVHALELRVPSAEVRTRYFERPVGSSSKLSTYRDGLRILATMARLFRDVKPLPFFSAFAVLFAAVGLILGAGVVVEFMKTGLVPRLPTAVLATGLILLASLSFACGMILDSVARGRREAKRLAYLAASARCDRR